VEEAGFVHEAFRSRDVALSRVLAGERDHVHA